MASYFTVSSNSLHTRDFPWILDIKEGLALTNYCQSEQRYIYDPIGQMSVELERYKGLKWPDALGCGAWPLLIFSEKAVESWHKERLGLLPIHEVLFLPPLPKKLQDSIPPKYYWIDGSKLKGALTDFEASGFVDVSFCPECGVRTDNISKTFDRQYAQGVSFSYYFRENSLNGLNLFTTDISDAEFFCSDAFVECANKYNLTNFRFVPIEEGHGWKNI